MTREKDKKPGKEQQLLEAARLGQVDHLETLLKQFQQLKTKKRSNPLASLRKCIGPNTIRDPVTGFTCLHHAALNGHSEIVQLIVSYGARLNAVDYKGSTALHLASWSGNIQVVKTLMSYLRATHMTSGQASYRSSSLSVSSEAAPASTPTSLDSGCAAPAGQIKSSSPIQNKHTSQQQAASPDAGDCAAQQQKLEIDHRNNDNQTALSLAAQFGHSQVVEELLAHGADPNLRNNQLESPLDLACLNGHLDTVRVLLSSLPFLVKNLRKPHSTISISTHPLSPTSQQDDSAHVKRYPSSASGWSSLLRGTTMKDLSPKSERSHKAQRRATIAPGGGGQQTSKHQMSSNTSHQYSLDSSSPTVSERLLDHSPLHYAVRRAHLTIVDLLLNYYEANIYQLTSLGSVMHELVMGDHSFRDSTRSGSAKHYPHSDIMRVFLARLSRMSAGNLNETLTRWQHLLSARNGQQRSIFDILNDTNNRELQRTIMSMSEQLEHNFNRQCQQLSQQQPVNPMGQHQQRQQVLFSNSHHLNSFVTMKRPSKSTRTRDDESQADRQHRQQAKILPDGTQTIGRRKISSKNLDQTAYAPQINYQFDQATTLARSISKSSLGQNDLNHLMTQQADMERPSTINWPALSVHQNQQFAQQLQHQQQMLNRNTQAMGKKRSNSRDLGSILKELHQNGTGTSTGQEQLYDNQLLPSMGQQHGQLSSNHLVRSQTDCSHLLGRFFGQQQATPNLRHPAGGEHRLHYQQQNQHAHSSENSSIISGLDQERLVPTSIAQQHSATLDRRSINRHYHVYEHEFYPPRLVTATHQAQGNKPAASHHASARVKQVVAIVPPLVHNPAHSIERAHRLPAQAADTQATNNNRLSLDMENIASCHGQLPDAGYNQQDQINRFVGRSTRKSTGRCELGQQKTAMPDTCQVGHDYGQQPIAMQRPQSMHSSQSLESRLGADSQQALSFENTRRALMRDFDKMLGRELLNNSCGNKYSDHSSDGGQYSHSRRNMPNSTSSSSQNSILTGISLDMDTRGEHLTVSGTRITMPEMQDTPPGATMMNQSNSSGSVRSSPLLDQASSQRVSLPPRDSSAQTTRKSSQHTQTGSDNLSQSSITTSSVQQNRREPPQKPPRPSLESQQIYKALRMGAGTLSDLKQQGNPIIYDVPSHNNSLSNLSDPVRVACRPSSRASINSSCAMMATPSSVGAPPARPPQPRPRRSGVGNDSAGEQQQQKVSITQPPSGRPPPPPILTAVLSSPPITSPLEVITATSKRNRLKGPLAPSLRLSLSSSSCCNSPNNSSSSLSFKALLSQRPDLVLDEVEARNIAPVGAHIIFQPATEGGDSGVCTSNSPASNSHDSDTARPPLELSFESRVYTKPNICAGNAIIAPPSPRTAQMSIEEAFIPLEESTTNEVANQANPVECLVSSDEEDESADTLCFDLEEEIEQATSFELGLQVDEIFGWLGTTNKSLEDQRLDVSASSPMKAGYENCIDLQDCLRARRCRSIGDLFRVGIASELNESHNAGELSNCSIETDSLSVELTPARTCSSKNGNYDATSETQAGDQPESSSLESQPVVCSDQHDSESATLPRRQCKEIMVRVVVDESQKETNGDDVFYISSLELKKISSKVDMASESTNTIDTGALQRSEAETLTEEELCASVDKNSGYIRFTLRKRSAASTAVNDSHLEPSSPLSLIQTQMPQTIGPSDRLKSISAKRTKINSDEREVETNGQLAGPMQTSKCESNKTMQQVIEHEERREQVNTRKASGDSISMDTSHTSSSSSTSEMSIRSIVSLKVQQPGSIPTDPLDNQQVAPVNANVNVNLNVNLNLKDDTEPREQTPTLLSVAQSFESVQTNEKKVDGEPEQVKETALPKVATSLVSETARRIEAAAASRVANGTPLAAAAAAARIVLNKNSPNLVKFECEKKEYPRTPAPPPKKSVCCWPPKKATDDNDKKTVPPRKVDADANDETSVTKTTTSTPTGPVVGRVSANRLSFQRLIEERSKAAAAANSMLNRTKPPPPVKPAGLIVPQSFKS